MRKAVRISRSAVRGPHSVSLILTLLVGIVLSTGFGSQPVSVLAATYGPPYPLYLPLITNLSGGPTLFGCPAFPADNIWNRRIDTLPVDTTHSAAYISSMGGGTGLHPDFGAHWPVGPFGIPFTHVLGTQPKVIIHFTAYGSQSDPGPYPIPPDAPVEDGSDSHVLVVDQDNCKLYELFSAVKLSDNSWNAGSGAVFDLRSNVLRPSTWTSADAAGLPILPGLVRYDEVAAGSIRHAIRFTANVSQKAFIWPARHQAGSTSSKSAPPMGARFRLKAGVNISGFDPKIQVIFKAFKEYGLILADNGSDWYISGAPDARWNDDILVTAFRQLHGSDFEAVDESSLMISPDSGQSR
jgi:hypothetical protein